MDVRYKHGPWQEMKEAIIRLKRDSERTFLQMDDLLGSIERKIDRLDSDRSISFHHTSKKTTINHLFDDYDQLVNYCHRVGETVSRHIDEPFYHKMDEFAGKMRDLSIRNYTTENRIGSTEYKAMPTAHSYGRLETSSVQKDTITIDDIFKDSVAFDEILNLQYEEMKRNNPEAKLDYNEYRKLIPSMRGFEYETMEEEQQDLEMWRDLAIAAGIIVAAVVCPPVAIAATAVFTGLEVKSVVTGEDWGTGRKLSTGEQIERGAFSVLGVIPGVKGVRQAFRGTDNLISLTKQSIAQNLAKFNPNTGKNVVQSLKDSNTYWTQKLRLEGLKATDKLNDVNYAIKGAFARSLDNMNNLAAQSIDVTAGGAAALGRGGSNVEEVVKASHLESKGIIQSKIEKIEGSIKGTGKDSKVSSEDSLNKINGFINGTKNFDDVIDDYVKLYGEKVLTNKTWAWNKSFPGGENLTARQKRMIKEKAVADGLIPEVKVTKVDGMRYGFADFKGAGLVIETKPLPKNLWLSSDDKQFDWLDTAIGGRPEGTTWHHTEIPGKMELVPFGIHNITIHNGGRSTGMWADAPR
ncbi:HNH endonuclease [Priestia taiwanensis]|uniref:Toxin/Nuclease N-terminal domain-containing protein n=1 Tax=Priestia taiwanensis TaxID=1347902 RepID=A0A917AKT6_9BACI|nr:HNH endonuclease [Priestia taiwanensis]MBM7362095.1 hypothetical protein [Priestia taiwanensis]GGE59409.1 hypothetical protein GCM10007140_07180 [Priestia taiwanensis]